KYVPSGDCDRSLFYLNDFRYLMIPALPSEAMAKFLDKSGAFTKTGDERAQQPQPTEEDQGNDEGDEQSEERYGLIEGEETDEE
ncbi:hypothetical protein C0989_000374, partial [Termitomyces sp. Mn162]